MSAKRIRVVCEHVYMLAVCAFLLWDIPYMTEAQWTFDIRGCFPAVWYGLAAAALVMARLKMGAAWLPAGLLAWMAAASAYRGANVLTAQLPMIAHGVLAFLVILPAPRIVEMKRLTGYLRGLLAVWTAFLTAQAVLGLWAALTGHAVFSLKGTWYIGVNLGDNRLYLNAYVTTGAVKLGLSVLLAMVGAALARRPAAKMLYALCALAQLLCLSLTDCRTAFIAVGAGLGAMAAAAICRRGEKRRWLRLGCALAAALVLTVGMYLTLSRTLTALAPHVQRELDNITMLELPAHLLPEAAAEEAVQHRALEADNLFNNRQIIWTAALRLLRSEPKFLLTGTTAALAPALTNAHILPAEYAGRPFAHVHNIYLQTLVSWGLPGFLLLAALLTLFLLAARRVLFRHRGLPLWQRIAPVPALYVMLCEMVDCFTRLSENSPLLLYGCLFAGLTLAIDARARGAAYADRPVEAAVDVIIPVYNAADYVARAVRSALAGGAARVILVDDGSTDGSGAVCDMLAERDLRVTVVHQENRGASAARNAGMTQVRAELAVFLDADDLLVPGALAALTAQLGDADAIQGRIVRKLPDAPRKCKTVRMSAREALAVALNDPTRHLLCHGWVFRASMLTERFDESLSMGEDGEWLLRTLKNAKNAAFCDVPAYCYTVRADSALHGGGTDVTEAYLETLAASSASLNGLDMPQEAAMYRLTHLLLMLTHGDLNRAAQLRESVPFAEDFRHVRLRGASARVLALRLLKGRIYPLAKLAIRMRRWRNSLVSDRC